MEQVSENQGLKTNETIRAVVREFHTAIKHKDAQRLGELVVQEVFVFGAAANEVSTGRDQFVAGLCSEFEAAKGARLGVKEEQIQVGICNSGLSAWFLDRFDLEIADGREAPRVFPFRFTGLLVQDLGWRPRFGRSRCAATITNTNCCRQERSSPGSRWKTRSRRMRYRSSRVCKK
jgi:ketosteroid isomerase-like protein